MADMSVLSADRMETVVPVVAWRDVLRPPDGLLARVRWLFTIAALGMAVVLGLGGAAPGGDASHPAGRLPRRRAALAGWLSAERVRARCRRRGGGVRRHRLDGGDGAGGL